MITKLFLLLIFQSHMIFNFSKNTDVNSWRIIDDGVMGGLSQGNFNIDKDGNGKFYGYVSLENYGGFSSVRCRIEKEVKEYTKIVLRVKGDGKKYQFRLKESLYDYHSYVSYFKTDGTWQEIEISMAEMYPTFRGRKLKMKNFSGKQLQEIAFLVGNKKEESFQLLIDKIYFK